MTFDHRVTAGQMAVIGDVLRQQGHRSFINADSFDPEGNGAMLVAMSTGNQYMGVERSLMALTQTLKISDQAPGYSFCVFTDQDPYVIDGDIGRVHERVGRGELDPAVIGHLGKAKTIEYPQRVNTAMKKKHGYAPSRAIINS